MKSVAEQTWQGAMRVIVADDGSSAAHFREVQKVCDEFRSFGVADLLLLQNPHNLGRPKTRNRLLEHTGATYVAWLDAGDIWYPTKLAVQFEHLLRLQYLGRDIDTIWVTCPYDWHQLGHDNPRRILQDTTEDQLRNLLNGGRLRAYLWTLLGTAQAFRVAGKFDEDLPRLQDLDYFLTFLRAGGRIEVPATRTAQCCYFKSDIGRNAREISACYDLILRKHRPLILQYDPAFRSELAYKKNRLAGRFALSNGERLRAAGYFTQAIILSPRHSIRVLWTTLSRRWNRGGDKA